MSCYICLAQATPHSTNLSDFQTDEQSQVLNKSMLPGKSEPTSAFAVDEQKPRAEPVFVAVLKAPTPELMTANPEREGVPWAAVWHQPRFSRIGLGADISPLGIGIKATTPLNDYFDARLVGNLFNFNGTRYEVDGFNIYGHVHLASMGADIDLYPWNSVWRVSAGLMFVNGNQVSADTRVAGGTSFKLGSQTFYSSDVDPVTGTAKVGFHTVKPEPMVSFGFGRFVPHSNRHWSFPTEFGLMYMGAPSLAVTPSGTVCTDKTQTLCSDVSDASSPVGTAFNSSLDARLTKWRQDLSKVKVYPIFSYGVVYSFNVR